MVYCYLFCLQINRLFSFRDAKIGMDKFFFFRRNLDFYHFCNILSVDYRKKLEISVILFKSFILICFIRFVYKNLESFRSPSLFCIKFAILRFRKFLKKVLSKFQEFQRNISIQPFIQRFNISQKENTLHDCIEKN
jgi:hypothetical protein